MKPKTIADVMRNPVVAYRVSAVLNDEEVAESYDTEREARDAAEMLHASGAAELRIERVTLRIVEEINEIHVTQQPRITIEEDAEEEKDNG
jgi:hypothetical protein